ncbi:hypothetical protein MBLNU459_g1388t1 [Dothideomycetes sp. NU459]
MELIPDVVRGAAAMVARPEILVPILIIYVFAANALRFRRMKQKHRDFNYPNRDSLASMTVDDAQKIQLYLLKFEFPFTTEKALQFALFRTYGIPTISKVLTGTTQLSNRESASKRFTDTGFLILEFIGQEPSSPRSLAALSRMNYIHSLYQKSGLISNDDMLYTLSLFALEPIRWVQRYEWRDFTQMETCAMGVFWEEVGKAMNINYNCLPSAKTGWKDGVHWIEEVEAWSIAYEKRYMVPDINNKKTADHTTNILLWSVPDWLRSFGLQAVSTLMDQRLREAMMYSPPSAIVRQLIQGILVTRKYAIRYLALPRPSFMELQQISDPDKQGRQRKLVWDAEPWYVEGSFRNRWSLQAWIDWIGGRPIPGDQGDKFQPKGIKTFGVGPKSMQGKGLAECDAEIAAIKARAAGRGCPMAFGRG